MSGEVIVHVIRHAHIPSHESDVALTPEGHQAAYLAGRQLATVLSDGEVVSFLHGPSRRTRETALGMYRGMREGLATAGRTAVQLMPPESHPDLRNLGLMVNGRLQEAMRLFHDQVRMAYAADPSPENRSRLAYHDGFWGAEDPLDYWMKHPSPHAENPEWVAARIRRVIHELLSASPSSPSSRQRILCITHSACMRAYLHRVLGVDPGEPDFCESFTVKKMGDGSVQIEFRGWVVNSERTHGNS
jgi:broad specificity phosphatase PhoE